MFLGNVCCYLVDGTFGRFGKASRERKEERNRQEQKANHLEWQKKESALAIIQRKDRISKTNGLDLRYTHKSNALLCDEEHNTYDEKVLIDCTDLDNPREFFTGVSLNSNEGIFLVNQVRESDDRCYNPDWSTMNSVSKKLKDEFPEDYANYDVSGLGKINDLEELTNLFGECSNELELFIYKNRICRWISYVKENYMMKHNVDNMATNTGTKILQLGAINSNNTNNK